jgi:hypothetical protein
MFGHFKQGTKTANTRQHALTHGFASQGLDALDQRITGIDVNAGVFVGEGSGHGDGREGESNGA